MDQFTITMRLSWLDAIQNLGDAERGRLLTGMLEYARKQEPKGLRGNERFVFESMRNDLDKALAQDSVQNAQNDVQNERIYREIYSNLHSQPTEEGTKNTQRLFSAMFDEFWKAYPLHVNRKRCVALWQKIKPDEELLAKMLESIEAWKSSDSWRRGYVPYPDTWLRNERWEADIPRAPRQRFNRAVDYGSENYEQHTVRLEDLQNVIDFNDPAWDSK